MICLSHSATIRLIDDLSVDYDKPVSQWSDGLVNCVEVINLFTRYMYLLYTYMYVQFPVEGNGNSEVDLQFLPPIEEDMEFDQDSSLDSSKASSPDSSRESSPDPPSFSSITSDEENEEHDEREENEDDDTSMYDINLQLSDILPDSFNDDHMDVDGTTASWWMGFKIVGDNVDKSFNPSFQRINRAKQSLHYFHAYAVLDRIDFSGLSEYSKQEAIDVNSLLPNVEDLKMMKSNFEVLVSRYVDLAPIIITICVDAYH